MINYCRKSEGKFSKFEFTPSGDILFPVSEGEGCFAVGLGCLGS